jgi:hypothetical protein
VEPHPPGRGLTALALTLLAWSLALAAAAPVGKVTGIYLRLLLHRGDAAPVEAAIKQDLWAGDLLETGPGCQAVILLGDGSEVKMEQGTRLLLEAWDGRRRNLVVEAGKIYARFMEKGFRSTVQTPTGIMGVEGTEVVVIAGGQGMRVGVLEGRARVALQPADLERGTLVEAGRLADLEGGAPVLGAVGDAGAWAAEVRDYLGELEVTYQMVRASGPLPQDQLEARRARFAQVVAAADFPAQALLASLLEERLEGRVPSPQRLEQFEQAFRPYRLEWQRMIEEFQRGWRAAYPAAEAATAEGEAEETRQVAVVTLRCRVHTRLKVRGTSVSGTVVVEQGIQGGPTGGAGRFEGQLEGSYDPTSQTLSGTFQGAGTGQAANASGAIGAAGGGRGTWTGRVEGDTLQGTLTFEEAPPPTRTWSWSARVLRPADLGR